MFHNRQLHDWFTFSRALELRFGPSSYQNHQAELFKLYQHGTVSDYQAAFEKLCNRVIGLPHDMILNCFLSGLSADVHRELAILQLTSISQAIGLAKLVENKLKDSKFRSRTTSTTSTIHSNPATLINRPTTTQTTPPPNLLIKKLTSSQI